GGCRARAQAAGRVTTDALCHRPDHRLDRPCHRAIRDGPAHSAAREVRRRRPGRVLSQRGLTRYYQRAMRFLHDVVPRILGSVLWCAVAGLTVAGAPPRQQAPAAAPQPPDYVAPEIRRLSGRTLRAFPAPEADQGVAADARHFYAVDNTQIAKYEIA